jgi:SAM-dependent methyltransferase
MEVKAAGGRAVAKERTGAPACRFCGEALRTTFADLGMSPLSNAYLSAAALRAMEPFYPLHAYVCSSCWLVQVEAFQTPQEIFADYAYFSSYSDSWLEHARRYAESSCRRFGLDARSLVIEVASNDGYLLQYFKQQGIPVLGVEPAANVAKKAQDRDIPTLVNFMGTRTAQELVSRGRRADLVVGNNVFAHVPDLHDFTAGLAQVMKPEGTLTLEFPHLLRLIEGGQFDTIYHEHFSYFSLSTARRVLAHHGLIVFDVDELATHGGSLRVYACLADCANARMTPNAARVLAEESAAGLERVETYSAFAERVRAVKRGLLRFLIEAREQGKSVAGYGAPAKGNTLLNYCGIREDLLAYTVDRNPYKQGRFLPGTHIPIHPPERIAETRPDYVLVLPWNLADEIVQQMSYVRDWGCKFVIPIPQVRVIS